MDSTPVAAESGRGGVAQVGGFLRAAQAEMKKVTWPSRPELIKATRMIIIFSMVLGVVIGLLDFALQLTLVDGVARLTR